MSRVKIPINGASFASAIRMNINGSTIMSITRKFSQIFPGISYGGVAVREGRMFSASYLTTGIADDGVAEMNIQTGSKTIYLMFEVSSTDQATIDVFDGTTYTGNGTSVKMYNRALPNGDTHDCNIYHTPTVNSDGDQIAEGFIPGGGRKNSRIGGSSLMRDEFVVGNDASLLIRATNTSGNADAKIFIKALFTID